jgi:hypothetical protein
MSQYPARIRFTNPNGAALQYAEIMPLFEDSWKRIKRAKVHAKAFWDEVPRMFPEDGYTVNLDKENERTWIVTAVFKTVPDDEVLSLELGEYFYQLRAALDALIWKAVWIKDGSEPPADANRLEFPIYLDKGKFDAAAIHKFNFPQELRDWIAGIQPYSAEKPIGDPDLGLSLTLQTLHDCARKDRHRRLHVAAAVASAVQYDFRDGFPKGVTVRSAEILPADFLKGKNAFLRLELASETGTLPSFQRHLATALKIDISVDGITNSTAEGFPDELIRFGGATEHVINRFESVYAKLGY